MASHTLTYFGDNDINKNDKMYNLRRMTATMKRS